MTQVLQQEENGTSLMGTTVWCLVSFLKGDPAPKLSITEPMIPTLIDTLYRTDVE